MADFSASTISRPIAAGLASLGCAAPSGAVATLADYLALVAKWNRAYNITAVDDPEAMVVRHVLDSAAALPFVRGTRMLDAGSGAGFPGLVLAILTPRSEWVLAESAGKKARFLDHAVRHLGLRERVSVHAGRLERYRPGPRFDTVTARALAELAALVGWAEPLVAPGGRFVALKGRRAGVDAEVAALPQGWDARVERVEIPDLGAERHIVVLNRAGETKE